MAREAATRGFILGAPERLDVRPGANAYRDTAQTSLGISDAGATNIWIDATDGHELAFESPHGSGWLALVNGWSDALHEAAIWSLPYRIAVSVFGLLVTTLAVTEVMIWSKKRAARLRRRRRP